MIHLDTRESLTRNKDSGPTRTIWNDVLSTFAYLHSAYRADEIIWKHQGFHLLQFDISYANSKLISILPSHTSLAFPTHLPIFAVAYWNPSYHSPCPVLHWFYHILTIKPHATSTGYTKPYVYVKPVKFIIILYAAIRILNTTYDPNNTINNDSIFNTKHAEFSTTW